MHALGQWFHKVTIELAQEVVKIAESGKASYKPLHADELPLMEKVRTIARDIYRASDISFDKKVADLFKEFENGGCGKYPACIAKTQYSFYTDPNAKGGPKHVLAPAADDLVTGGRDLPLWSGGRIGPVRSLAAVPAFCACTAANTPPRTNAGISE